MDRDKLIKLLHAADAFDAYCIANGTPELQTFSGSLLAFTIALDPEQNVPEPEREYTLTEAAALLA